MLEQLQKVYYKKNIMEINNNSSLENDILVTENITELAPKIATKFVERVKSFSSYAFEKAGLNKGDAISLKTYLQWIKDGHLVEDTYDENEQTILKQQVEKKISDTTSDKLKIEGDKRRACEVSKPTILGKIKELTDEIQQTKIDLAEDKVATGYQSEKYFVYASLTILLSFYLLFFYASSIYAAFFRNAQSTLEMAGDDIAMYLDSIFDVKGIFTASPILVIVYLGAFVFFAMGLLPHCIEGKNKKMNVSLALFGAFIADGLMAYKIDSGIHNLKVMAGVSDEEWVFYTSINFYLVLIFGFCAYLLWGFMFEMMLKEKNKKAGNVTAALIIKGLKEEIKNLKAELQVIEAKIIELETEIQNLQNLLDQLKKDLESRMLNPDSLSQNLTSFYSGWLQYLNNTSLIDEKTKCNVIYNEFMETLFEKQIALQN